MVIFGHRYLDNDCINFPTFVFLAVYWSIWTLIYNTDIKLSSTIFKSKPPQCETMSLSNPVSFCSQNLNRYTPLPPSTLQPSTISVTSVDPTYEALSVEEKNFVNTIVGMGFPKGRTARAVKNVGNDDRQVWLQNHNVTIIIINIMN